MSAMRVATFAISNTMLRASLKTQAKLADVQLQESSGVVSTDYGGLGSAAGQVIDTESAIARANAYADTASTAEDRVQQMYDTLTQMTDLITSFKSTLSSASVDDTSSLAENAASMRDEFVSLLNTRYQGRYLFGGSSTGTEPVSLDEDAYSLSGLSTADTSYYQGNGALASARVSASQSITYGVTADSDGFEKALRVLASFANADTDTMSSDDLSTGIDLLAEAMDAILVKQTGLSAAASSLSNASDRQTSTADTLSDLLSSERDSDVTALAVKVSTYEAQLEASYSALSKISAVSLLNYK